MRLLDNSWEILFWKIDISVWDWIGNIWRLVVDTVVISMVVIVIIWVIIATADITDIIALTTTGWDYWRDWCMNILIWIAIDLIIHVICVVVGIATTIIMAVPVAITVIVTIPITITVVITVGIAIDVTATITMTIIYIIVVVLYF